MGLRYVIGNAEDQADSINRYCNKVIEAMNQSINALRSFTDDTQLQGKTYESAKNYVKRVHLPLAKGMVEVCEELSKQNKKYPNKYRSEVATVTVDEDQVNQHIDNIRRQKRQEETFNEVVPNPHTKSTIEIFEEMERQLRKKIEHLYEFNSETRGYFDTVNTLLDSLRRGFNELDNHQVFNSKMGTFSTDGMDLSWSKKFNDSRKKYNPKEAQIEELEDTYGLDRKTAEELYKFSKKFHKYSEKKGWDKKEETYQFAMLLASLSESYSSNQWKIAAGTMDPDEAKKLLKEMGFSYSFVEDFATIIKNNHGNKGKHKYNNDIAHIMGSLAVILNTNNASNIFMKVGTSGTGTLGVLESNNIIGKYLIMMSILGSQDNKNAAATFRGDIASGQLDQRDFRADIDALNINNRIRKGESIENVINDYSKHISNGGNRILEIERELGNGDLKKGEDKLNEIIHTPITDAGDFLQELSTKNFLNGTKDQADKFWKLVQEEKRR